MGSPTAEVGARSFRLQLRPRAAIIRRDGPIPRAGQRRRSEMSANDVPIHKGERAQTLWDQTFLVGLRRDMLRFAELQLRDRAAAEDAVQEALAAALSGQDRFAGQAALKTWVFAILKNKIIDHLRQRQRFVEAAHGTPETSDDTDDFDVLFNHTGYWKPDERPQTWGDPEATFAQQQF